MPDSRSSPTKLLQAHLAPTSVEAFQSILDNPSQIAEFSSVVESSLIVNPGTYLGASTHKNSLVENHPFEIHVNPLAGKDITAVKDLLNKLKKGSDFCTHIIQFSLITIEDDSHRKDIIIKFLQDTNILSTVQYVICDSLLTGGLGCGVVRTLNSENELVLTNPAALILELGPLIKATGLTYQDFFDRAQSHIELRKPILTMAMELDEPTILLTVLGKTQFDAKDRDEIHMDLLGQSILAYAKDNKKHRIAEQINIAVSKQELSNPKGFFSTDNSDGFFAKKIKEYAVKDISKMELANIELTKSITNIVTAAREYLHKFPKPIHKIFGRSHQNQNQAKELIDIAENFMGALTKNYGSVKAYENFISQYHKIFNSLSNGCLRKSLLNNTIIAPQIQSMEYAQKSNLLSMKPEMAALQKKISRYAPSTSRSLSLHSRSLL